MSTDTMEPKELEEQATAATDDTAAINAETTLELEHYKEIKELNRELIEVTQSWESHKARAASGKKIVDELGQRLSYLIARGPDRQQKLPFESANAGETPKEEPKPDDSWKNVPVAEALSLTAKQLERLEEAGARTIGQLEDLRGGEGLTSVAGIGQATADKIEEQVLEWLSENRDRFGEVVDQGDADEEIEDAGDEDEDDDSEDDSNMLEDL